MTSDRPASLHGGSAHRCDIVFLPPSFPIVAMENPCLTFIIASILESSEFLLIDVIHEIAHGWFGNAVTNATWEEMWLSEGLATYAQRRITTEAYGRSAAGPRPPARRSTEPLSLRRRGLHLSGDGGASGRPAPAAASPRRQQPCEQTASQI